jgi:hypothetical protein
MAKFLDKNQFYLTHRQTASGMVRMIFVWNGKDFVRKGLLTGAQAMEFIKWAAKQGVSYVAPKGLEVNE